MMNSPSFVRVSARQFLLLALCALLQTSVAARSGDIDTALDACNESTFATTLIPGRDVVVDARAIAVSTALIKWPKVSPRDGESFALYFSRRGQLRTTKGQRVAGHESRISLARSTAALPPALSTRFDFLGDGVVLSMPTLSNETLSSILVGQLVIVHEDAQRRVLDVTTIQHPALIDERYASAERFNDFGATHRRLSTHFRLWAPTAQGVHLCVYDAPLAPSRAVYRMRRHDVSGTWTYRLPTQARERTQSRTQGVYYTYLVDVWVNGVGAQPCDRSIFTGAGCRLKAKFRDKFK
jgi:pullulanase